MSKHPNEAIIQEGVARILDGLGYDDWQNDPNLYETPFRVAKMYAEMCRGLYEDGHKQTTFPSNYSGMIGFTKIHATGICPHHLLPIEYMISFAYLPDKKVLGLSKVPRIVKSLCARPVLQEDLTQDIVRYFEKTLKPNGIAIVVEGIHGCMKYRGINEAEPVKTSELSGRFMIDDKARKEFYSLISL